MMRPLLVAGVLAGFLLQALARADFALQPPPAQEWTPPQEQPRRARPAPRRPAVPVAGMAIGFGEEVPLNFAVRQIVPPGVPVRYGPGADASGLVTWRGGAPWPQVLQAAVRPLGLVALFRPGAVEIRPAPR